MTEPPITAGVIGVGTMGQHHARVYKEIPDVRLAGIADVDAEQARQIATKYGTVARDRDAVIDRCDVVSVAVPTRFHFEVAKQALEAGVHVLVEKPFVRDVQEGRSLVELARAQE
jgi:predicted dehydrogenase